MAIKQKNLRGFIRIDRSGKIIANSLTLRTKPPKYGVWQEIPVYDRFVTMDLDNDIPEYVNTSYAVHVASGSTATFEYDDAETGLTVDPITLVGPASQLINAKTDSIVITDGPMIISILGEYVA